MPARRCKEGQESYPALPQGHLDAQHRLVLQQQVTRREAKDSRGARENRPSQRAPHARTPLPSAPSHALHIGRGADYRAMHPAEGSTVGSLGVLSVSPGRPRVMVPFGISASFVLCAPAGQVQQDGTALLAGVLPVERVLGATQRVRPGDAARPVRMALVPESCRGDQLAVWPVLPSRWRGAFRPAEGVML